jgi:hypothetical protein
MSLVKYILRYAYQRHGRYGYDHDHRNDGYSHLPYEGGYRAVPSAASLPARLSRYGRRLIYILAIATVIALIGLVGLLMLLLPLAMDAIDFVYRNGVSGVLDLLTSIIDKLWKGVGS